MHTKSCGHFELVKGSDSSIISKNKTHSPSRCEELRFVGCFDLLSFTPLIFFPEYHRIFLAHWCEVAILEHKSLSSGLIGVEKANKGDFSGGLLSNRTRLDSSTTLKYQNTTKLKIAVRIRTFSVSYPVFSPTRTQMTHWGRKDVLRRLLPCGISLVVFLFFEGRNKNKAAINFRSLRQERPQEISINPNIMIY